MARFQVVLALTLTACSAFLLLALSLNGRGPVPNILPSYGDGPRTQVISAPSHHPTNKPISQNESDEEFDAGEADGDEYLLGVGKADITGPVVEINLMGYADPNQLGTGVRQRLYARSFIIGSLKNPEDRIVYVVLDTQSGDTAIRHGILEGLKNLEGPYARYGRENVAITGTHSHSGPGAWLNYLLPQITSKGFNKQSYDAIVSGTILSIQRAHSSLQRGHLSFGSIEIKDANINRSPSAYLNNPQDERDKYSDNVDKTMTLLRFSRSSDGKSMGVLTWFPVHGTSMLGNNTLITGDNKGVAAYLFEKSMKEAGEDGFVAGFSQSNVGDTSPNILGAWCEDGSGKQCTFETSLCGGKSQPCHGRGPYFGLDDGGTKSCFEIGRRQFEGARTLLQSMEADSEKSRGISGHVGSLHTFRSLANYTFTHPNGSTVRTCPAALGYSFAAGTTDGPGAFDFKQNSSGNPQASPVWAAVRNFIHAPSEEQKACHAPKPILLDVGETTSPYLWTPNTVDIQLLRVGQLIMIVAPGEATTMAGRRWKEAIASAATKLKLTGSASETPLVVLGGPANTYAHYIATEEEYAIQRYEGASTLYGPHTLNAYIDLTVDVLPYLSAHAPDNELDPGPEPPIHTNSSLSFITPVLFDRPPLFSSFGECVEDVLLPQDYVYKPGDKVFARFVGANPRNNLHQEETYATVKKRIPGTVDYEVYRTDEDWEVVFEWKRTSTIEATSEVTITWEVPEDVDEGYYRLFYDGDSKALGRGRIEVIKGVSEIFRVEP